MAIYPIQALTKLKAGLHHLLHNDFRTFSAYQPANDGVTDDSVLLQQAIDELPAEGGTIVLSSDAGAGAGYLIDAQVTDRGKPNVVIKAKGRVTLVFGASSPGSSILLTGEDSDLVGFKMDATAFTHSTLATISGEGSLLKRCKVSASSTDGTSYARITMSGDNQEAFKNTFDGAQIALYSPGTTGFQAVRNTFTNCRTGIYTIDCDVLLIEANRVLSRQGTGATPGMDGILVGTSNSSVYNYSVSILGNHIFDCREHGIYVSCPIDGLNIATNNVRNHGSAGIKVYPSHDLFSRVVSITGNTVGAGQSLNCYGFYIGYIDGGSMTGNTAGGGLTQNTSLFSGIYSTGSLYNFGIKTNTVFNTQHASLELTTESGAGYRALFIGENNFSNASFLTTNPGSANIRIAGPTASSDGIYIDTNQLTDFMSPAKTQWGVLAEPSPNGSVINHFVVAEQWAFGQTSGPINIDPSYPLSQTTRRENPLFFRNGIQGLDKSGSGANFSDADFQGSPGTIIVGILHDTDTGKDYISVKTRAGVYKKVEVS